MKQDGNTLPRFLNKIDLGEQFGHGSMNSEGLPNQGIDYCKGTYRADILYGHVTILIMYAFRYQPRCCEIIDKLL